MNSPNPSIKTIKQNTRTPAPAYRYKFYTWIMVTDNATLLIKCTA